ncbi:MAG: MBL fold metallo-hydrolase [Syntrophomonadaceae bacterium]|jgi:glyoxylase-like metal-dependent hydrolase (beta-lactamase superfamily II)|nr:MBL fold metallo-hydrolase [Syntrophomonadaceae bacterium]
MDLLRLKLGITNCYLLRAEQGYIMVDAGSLRKVKCFQRLLKEMGILPKSIKLIIVTHAHYDHIGSLAEIKKLCDCQVLAHPLEARIMREGEIVIPPGTNPLGRMLSSIGQKAAPLLAYPSVDSEIIVQAEYGLEEYGIEGKVLPTPGHTTGSLSVLLANGNALVGDLAVNWTGLSFYPPFAERPEQIYYSWYKLCKEGAVNIFPAHGRPFAINRIEQELKKLEMLGYIMA